MLEHGSLLIDHHSGGAGRDPLGTILAIITIGAAGGTDGFDAIAFRLEHSTFEACNRDPMPLTFNTLCGDSVVVI